MKEQEIFLTMRLQQRFAEVEYQYELFRLQSHPRQYGHYGKKSLSRIRTHGLKSQSGLLLQALRSPPPLSDGPNRGSVY